MSTVTDTGRDPESIDGSFVPHRDPRVQMVDVDGEAILVDGDGGLHVLNATASLLWECFDGDVSIAELADEIATEMNVPGDAVLADTLRVTEDFLVRGILTDGREGTSTVVEPALADASTNPPDSGPQVLAEPPNT